MTSNRNHIQTIDRNACLSISSLGGSAMQKYGSNMGTGTKVALSAATRMLRSGQVGGTAEALGGGKFANGAVTGAYVMMFNHLMIQATKSRIRKQIEKQLSELLSRAAKESNEYFSDRDTYYSRDAEIFVGFAIDDDPNDTRFQKDYDVVISIVDENGIPQKIPASVRSHLSNNPSTYIGILFAPVGSRSGEGLHYHGGHTYEVWNRNMDVILVISFETRQDKLDFNTYVTGIWGK